MAYSLLAGTCTDGPCPTLYIDDATGDVVVQGYRPRWNLRRLIPGRVPLREGLLHIPAKDWEKLTSQLAPR